MSATPVPPEPGDTPAADMALASASAELKVVSEAIEELHSRLERANAQMNQVTVVRTTELEIGRLFMEAQRFTDTALAKLEHQIQEILSEASARAQEIVHAAEHEAEEIRRGARPEASEPPAPTTLH